MLPCATLRGSAARLVFGAAVLLVWSWRWLLALSLVLMVLPALCTRARVTQAVGLAGAQGLYCPYHGQLFLITSSAS